MRGFARRGAVTFSLLAPLLVEGRDYYPTKPDEQDKLCERMGATPNLSTRPGDRLWFRANCTCAGALCGKFDSRRFFRRLDSAAKALEARRAVADRSSAKRREEAARLEAEGKTERGGLVRAEAKRDRAADEETRSKLLATCRSQPGSCFSACQDAMVARGDAARSLDFCARLESEARRGGPRSR